MTRSLPPSLRLKRRYVLLTAPSKKAVEAALLEALGVFGVAAVSPVFVTVRRPLVDRFVLAIARSSLSAVRGAFELAPEKITILRVSGTLKSLLQNDRNL